MNNWNVVIPDTVVSVQTGVRRFLVDPFAVKRTRASLPNCQEQRSIHTVTVFAATHVTHL
jgi:hypothetical protein